VSQRDSTITPIVAVTKVTAVLADGLPGVPVPAETHAVAPTAA
jgi:hypothetical protein